MRRRPYPLEVVRAVRSATRDEALEVVRAALGELDDARERRARAAERLTSFRAADRGDRGGERRCSAADLQAEGRHRARLRAEEGKLADVLARRDVEVDRAAQAVSRARAALAQAEAEAKLVERHREGWIEGARRAEERRAEDERDDEAAGRRAARDREFRSRFREP